MRDPAVEQRVWRVRARTLTAAAAVSASWLAVRSGLAQEVDRRCGRVIARPFGRAVDRAVGIGTDLGSVYGLAGMAGAIALAGHRRVASDVAGAGLAAWSAAQASKPLLRRERPYETADADRLVAEPAGTSWPSGHVAVMAAVSTVVGSQLSAAARRGLGAATFAVALSRLYVGVHHTSDLVAGWGVGVLAARAWEGLRRRR